MNTFTKVVVCAASVAVVIVLTLVIAVATLSATRSSGGLWQPDGQPCTVSWETSTLVSRRRCAVPLLCDFEHESSTTGVCRLPGSRPAGSSCRGSPYLCELSTFCDQRTFRCERNESNNQGFGNIALGQSCSIGEAFLCVSGICEDVSLLSGAGSSSGTQNNHSRRLGEETNLSKLGEDSEILGQQHQANIPRRTVCVQKNVPLGETCNLYKHCQAPCHVCVQGRCRRYPSGGTGDGVRPSSGTIVNQNGVIVPGYNALPPAVYPRRLSLENANTTSAIDKDISSTEFGSNYFSSNVTSDPMLTDPTHFMKTQGTGREHDFYDPTVLPQSPSLAGSNPKSHGKNTRVLGDFSKQSDEAGNDPELTHTDTGAIIEGQQYMYPTPPSQYYGSPFDSIFTPRPPPPPGTLAKRISSLFDGIATAVGPLENINVNRMAQQVPAIAPNVQIQTGQLMPLAATAPAVIAAPSVPSVAVVSPQQVATVATGNRPVLVGEQVVRNPAGNPSVIARVSPPVVVPTAVGGQIVPPAAVLPMNTLPNTRGPAVVASVIPANGYPQTTIVANRPSTPVGPQTGISSAPRLPLAAVTNHDNRPSAYPQYSPFSARGNNTPSNRVPGSITNSPAGDNIISDVRYGSNNSGGVGSGIVVIDVTNPLGNLDSSQYTLEKCLDMCCSQDFYCPIPATTTCLPRLSEGQLCRNISPRECQRGLICANGRCQPELLYAFSASTDPSKNETSFTNDTLIGFLATPTGNSGQHFESRDRADKYHENRNGREAGSPVNPHHVTRTPQTAFAQPGVEGGSAHTTDLTFNIRDKELRRESSSSIVCKPWQTRKTSTREGRLGESHIHRRTQWNDENHRSATTSSACESIAGKPCKIDVDCWIGDTPFVYCDTDTAVCQAPEFEECLEAFTAVRHNQPHAGSYGYRPHVTGINREEHFPQGGRERNTRDLGPAWLTLFFEFDDGRPTDGKEKSSPEQAALHKKILLCCLRRLPELRQMVDFDALTKEQGPIDCST